MSSHLDFNIPTDSQPSEVLANRFEAWRKVINALGSYFKDYASAQEDNARIHTRLANSVSFPFEPAPSTATTNTANTAKSSFSGNTDTSALPDEAVLFLAKGSGSIADVPTSLKTYHKTQSSNASRTSKELLGKIVPRLDAVQTDLQSKIREIKGLAPDFKNSVSKEQSASSNHLSAYQKAMDVLDKNHRELTPKQDPYLLKDNLDKQLSRQVKEENYLLEAHVNILTSGKELETVVVQEIQAALSAFGKLVGLEAEPLDALSKAVLSGFPTKEPTVEWQHFLEKEKSFAHPDTKPRDISALAYPGQSSNIASQVRSGYLERRSKYLKSYSKAWYVLTPTFLHEFKSHDRRRDPHPALSWPIGDCKVSHDKKSTSDRQKFILTVKQPGTSSKSQNWVFRAENKDLHDAWFNDLTTLTQLEHPAKRADAYFPNKETTSNALPASPLIIAKDEDGNVSDSSEVSSLDEPFGVHGEEEALSPADADDEDRRPGPPGRFPSGVALQQQQHTGEGKPLERRASTFITPGEHGGLTTDDSAIDDDNSSVFSYDLKRETHSTLPEDKDFKPIGADIPVHVERRLTMTHHKDEEIDGGIGVARHPNDDVTEDPQRALQRRRSSVATANPKGRHQSTLSRKATGSFGVDDLKPLSTNEQPGLFFEGGLPDTTSSGTKA